MVISQRETTFLTRKYHELSRWASIFRLCRVTLTGQTLNTLRATLLRRLARRRCPARWIRIAGHPVSGDQHHGRSDAH
jgi:hypothetical protein